MNGKVFLALCTLCLLCALVIGQIASGAAPKSPDRFALLSMFESGNNDCAIGANGEISRYQIKPNVFAQYFFVSNPPPRIAAIRIKFGARNPFIAGNIAHAIMRDRVSKFIASHRRQPSDLEWYLLWNCPADVEHPSRKEHARAQRFANLCSKP